MVGGEAVAATQAKSDVSAYENRFFDYRRNGFSYPQDNDNPGSPQVRIPRPLTNNRAHPT